MPSLKSGCHLGTVGCLISSHQTTSLLACRCTLMLSTASQNARTDAPTDSLCKKDKSHSIAMIKMVKALQVRMLIHKDREGFVGMKKEPYSRISMALKYRIKEFVTHPNCQQVSRCIHAFLITFTCITALLHSKYALYVVYTRAQLLLRGPRINA